MSDRQLREILPGSSEPLGASVREGGTNFALWSHNGERVDLCLYDERGETELRRLTLPGRTGDVWHGFVPGLEAGFTYGYRVHGPHAPREGHRFNAAKLLIDPYARALTGAIPHHERQYGYDTDHADGDLSLDSRDDADVVPKCRIVANEPPFDAGPAPRTPWRDTVLYELHVKGYTRLSPFVPDGKRGTYAGLASPTAIAHLVQLGVTAVELLPIAAFTDEPHLARRGLTNYWGYNPVAPMAPEPRYAAGDARAELREAVRRLHEAGIEVILDVVFNHTGEGWHLGPILSCRGIDNAGYYRLDGGDRSRYVDHAGCGNTLDVSRPHVRRLILDTLRHWVRDYGVDGFRFDLATTLGREGDDARFSAEAAFFTEIAGDPVLADLKLIAEPWDLGPDGYRVGGFPAGWAEWNDRPRDAYRRFWRGDHGVVGELATRLAGSADLFAPARGPLAGVNFVAAHDGMRLRDLVTFAGKHNGANGEDNHDGSAENFSASYGPEGPSADAGQRALRLRQMKNLVATLLLSQGVPMLTMGDEVGHSQGGNNNAYCQDGPLSWIDWGAVDLEGRELLAFTRRTIALRRRIRSLSREGFLTGKPDEDGLKDVTWLAANGREMTPEDWQRPEARTLGMLLAAEGGEGHLLVLLNAHGGDVGYTLPPVPGGGEWQPLVDTAAQSESEGQGTGPLDPILAGTTLRLTGRSLAVLHADPALATAALDALSDLAGVARSWHDLSGVDHVVAAATRRTLLAALGFKVGTAAIEAETLREARAEPWRHMLPPVVVMRSPNSDAPTTAAIAVVVQASDAGQTLAWAMELEDGARRQGEAGIWTLREAGSALVDGVRRHKVELPLPADVPLGYHRLTVTVGAHSGEATVIAAPERCWLPDWLTAGERMWGVAHQLYSLRGEGASDRGIGDFTALGALADAVRTHGGAVVGVNPLHALSLAKPDDASPYAPSSRQFLNPLYIDVDAVGNRPSSSPSGHLLPRGVAGSPRSIDYAAIARAKLSTLWKLFQEFERHGGDVAGAEHVAAFETFRAARGEALDRFAIHQVLEERLGRAPADAWLPYGDAASAAVAQFAAEHVQRVRFHCWLQFEAERQLRLATGRGLRLGLYGDLAVGIDPNGADVWSEPEAFIRTASFGAPPDPFAAGGQDWGLVAFDPLYLRRSAYRPFRAMLAANMRHARAIRLDHVMWLERMFFIPRGAKPTEGTYVAYPRDELLAVLALESHRNRCLVVGEDLGTVPLGFRELMQREGMLSYKLMAFERYHDGFYKRPDAYAPLALATPASHDLPTLAGFWRGRDIEVRLGLGLLTAVEAEAARTARIRDRELLVAALDDQKLLAGDFPRGADISDHHLAELATAVHVFLARSPAALAMLNLEDLALSSEQVNLPGPLVGYPCWRVRMEKTVGEIFSDGDAAADLAAVTAGRRERLSDTRS